jgi:hypothetical protein
VGEVEDVRADDDPEHQLDHDDGRRVAFREHGDGDRGDGRDHDDDEERCGVDVDQAA